MRAWNSAFSWETSILCATGATPAIVEMQWRMLQQDTPEDFVIATGRQASVRDFIDLAAPMLGWGGIKVARQRPARNRQPR